MSKEHYFRCHICETVNYDNLQTHECRRCHAPIDPSLSNAYQRTLALLITSMILYVPANLYPILITKQFGSSSEATILGGVIHLWELGSYPIALIILLASVVVPLLKFLLLIYLLIAAKYPTRSSWGDKHRLFTSLKQLVRGQWWMFLW